MAGKADSKKNKLADSIALYESHVADEMGKQRQEHTIALTRKAKEHRRTLD